MEHVSTSCTEAFRHAWDESSLISIDRLFAEYLLPKGEPLVQHFLSYLLQCAREGDLCVLLGPHLHPDLVQGASLLPPHLFEEYLVHTEQQGQKRIYLRRNWDYEQSFLYHLKRITEQPPKLEIDSTQLHCQELNEEQHSALFKAAAQSLTLITGGPGSGKTYTASVLIRAFHTQGISRIAVAAPTGKATAHLRKALGPLAEKCTIKTLHSLVRHEPLYADLIVVDESSMIDAEWMAALFAAVPDGARLILLGDPYQLPPVETGNLFADLVHQEPLVASLNSCLRTDLQEILEVAACVKRGETIPFKPLPPIKELISLMAHHQQPILTPLRQGLYGSDSLNQLLFLEHEKNGDLEIPIMIRVNAPALDLYNGDIGLWHKTTGRVTFPNGTTYSEPSLPPYDYAYALTVHKSQGSEYDHVVLLIPPGAENFTREMLYTAVTRAKKKLTLYADPPILSHILSSRSHRLSSLQTPI